MNVRQFGTYRTVGQVPGRALFIGKNDELYIAQQYQILRSTDGGANWQLDCYVPRSGWKPWFTWNRLAARLLRYYIAGFHVLDDGSRLAIARDGIYRADRNNQRMSRVFAVTRGSRPLNLTVDGSRVLFGEYGSGLETSEVCLYVSEDYGRTFEVGFRFPRGDVRHVHNILVDSRANHYWVLVGDFGKQTGIGAITKDLRHIDWLSRGTQRCRAVSALIEDDSLVYGTDSDRECNAIVRMDKKSGRIDDLLEVEGSSLYATKFGPLRVISPCVEPNPHCPSRSCSLYVSENSHEWKRTVVHTKDRRHSVYFQFGTLVLPYACNESRTGMYSGQAVEGIDDTVVLFDVAEKANRIAA